MDNSGDFSLWFFSLSVLSLLFTATAIVRIKNIGPLLVPWFIFGWPGAELAWFHLAWEAAAIALLLGSGALDHALDTFALLLMLVCMVLQWRIHQRAKASGALFTSLLDHAGIRNTLPPGRNASLMDATSSRDWLRPFHMRRPGVEKLADIAYGDHPRNRLDIFRSSTPPAQPLPVLLQVHGGGWVIGKKEEQALPLMHLLAQNGWVCVTINYRLGPQNRMPAHIEDVKKALAWIKQNIGDYGGDPNFIAITGGSAGGHLSSLAALTPQLKGLQPGFEELDLAVQACVPFYGIYDFTDRNGDRGKVSMQDFLSRSVMPATIVDDPAMWDLLSPLSHVSEQAPPMLVIHGEYDSLAFVEEARSFVRGLREKTRQPLVYAELPQTQHAFEIFHSVRTEHTITAVQRFLEHCYAVHRGD